MRPQRQLAGEIEAVLRRLRQRVRQARLADRRHRKPRPRRRRPPGSAGAGRRACRGRRCAGSRAAPPRRRARPPAPRVERAGQPHRQRDRVGRRSAPSSRSRNHSRRCANDSGISAGRATGTQRRPRRLRLRRDARPAPPRSAPRTGCGSRARRPGVERMRLISRVASSECPPSSKKSSSMPTALDAQHLGEQPAQHLLLRRARRAAHAAGGEVGRRQRPAVELAVRRQRQRVQHHERRRHHVVGQARGQHAPAAPPASALAPVAGTT